MPKELVHFIVYVRNVEGSRKQIGKYKSEKENYTVLIPIPEDDRVWIESIEIEFVGKDSK